MTIGLNKWSRFRSASLCVVCLVFLAYAIPVYAGEPTKQMKQSIDAVIEVLKNSALKSAKKTHERRAEIRKIINGIFDFREMSKRALALNWKKRTPEERKEFAALFARLLEATYIEKIEKYSDEKIIYVSESVDDGYAEVRTNIIAKTGSGIPINYLLFKKGAKWVVYDVEIEGISLVENYRTQFEEIIGSESYDELVRKLKEKVRSTKISLSIWHFSILLA